MGHAPLSETYDATLREVSRIVDGTAENRLNFRQISKARFEGG